MSANLIDMFKTAVGGNLVSQASKFLGESEANTSSAMDAILPTLAGSLINMGGKSGGAKGILDFLGNNSASEGLLDNLGGLFGGGSSTDGLMGAGSTALKFLMGDKLGAVVDLIGGRSGLKTGSSSSLLRMAAPLLMGVVGKYVKNKALDAVGLGNFLGGQKSSVMNAVPREIGNLLGFGGSTEPVRETVAAGAERTTKAVHQEPKRGGGGFMPWVIGALALLGILFGIRMCGGAAGDAAGNILDKGKEMTEKAVDVTKDAGGAVVDAAGNAVDKAGELAGDAVDAVTSISLPGGKELKAAAGSFTAKFADFLSGDGDLKTGFAFDGVNFATGSANLTAESDAQIGELGDVLAAYPNVRIRIEGHTDSSGDAAKNQTLSQQRALAVKAKLQSLGVASNRVAAIGLGQTKPIADNNTEEGKAANRRVEVYVTKR